MADPTTCAFEACQCELSRESIVRRDKAEYCSARCADGRGCDHPDCNCGEFPEADSGTEPMI